MPNIDFSHLSTRERLDLIGEIWASIEAGAVPLSAAREAELDRRIATLDEDIAQDRTWNEIDRELDRRYK